MFGVGGIYDNESGMVVRQMSSLTDISNFFEELTAMAHKESEEFKIEYPELIPHHVIYSKKSTVVFWPDGTKTIVKCSKDDNYAPEFGVAMAIVKKVFGSRSAFMKVVEAGYTQPVNNKKTDGE